MDTAQPQNNGSQPITGPVVNTPEVVSTPSQPIQSPPSQKSRKKLILGLLAVFLLLSLGVGVYVFTMGSKQPTTDNLQLTTISPTVQPTIDPTAGWETATFKLISVKYPNNWRIAENERDALIRVEKNDSEITNKNNPSTSYIHVLYIQNVSLENAILGEEGIKEKKINNINGIEVTRVEGVRGNSISGTAYYVSLYIPRESDVFLIGIRSNNEEEKDLIISEFEQIASTFKFTDSDQASNQSGSGQAVDTSNWKAYINQKYGFSLSHPSDSSIETRDSGQYEYIRIQNFITPKTLEGFSLKRGDFSLEIAIYDHTLGRVNSDCKDTLINPIEVKVGTYTAYRGFGEGGGDSASYREALCVDAKNANITFQVNEQYDIVGEKIIDSVSLK